MKLLFRASEHGFSAKEFHRWCDGKAPTLVVVRTNFGKTLGGYTPVPWKSVAYPGEVVADGSGTSFMFSCDLKERFALKNKDHSITCHSDAGPCFGGFYCDLVLTDGSEKDRCWVNFPRSYSGNGRERNQETRTALIGNPNSNYFEVLEYEVFEVGFGE